MGTFAVEGIKLVSVNGAILAYVEKGRGEPVIFVHGGYSDLRTWLTQIPAFAQEYRAITYSRRYARPNEDIPKAGRSDDASRERSLCPPPSTQRITCPLDRQLMGRVHLSARSDQAAHTRADSRPVRTASPTALRF